MMSFKCRVISTLTSGLSRFLRCLALLSVETAERFDVDFAGRILELDFLGV